MLAELPLDPAPLLLAGASVLALAGAAVQVAVGAGLSVVAGPFLLLWLGPASGVPILLGLNLLVSVVATTLGGRSLPWVDVAAASGATLAGCLLAVLLPALPDAVLRGLTAVVLVAAAWPRPSPDPAPHPRRSEASSVSAAAGIAAAGLLTGALTVWTATPGPILAVALARAGRSGAEIRRVMQPISSVGYGVGLALAGFARPGFPEAVTLGPGSFVGLAGATLLGTGLGFGLRRRIDDVLVVRLVRVIAAVSALLLAASLLS